MLKQTALSFFLLGLAFSQTHPIEVHLDDITGRGVKCTGEVPKDFACAIFFEVDPPFHDGIDIASVVGGEGNFPQTPPPPVIREVSLILDGTLYTAVYDPPLKRDEKFSASGDTLAFLHESMVMPYSLNGPTVKKRRLRSFGAKRSMPISPNPRKPSAPLSHASASLQRYQRTARAESKNMIS